MSYSSGAPSSSARPAPHTSTSEDVRAHIVASLFSRFDESGTADETLISFLKVHERDEAAGGGATTPGTAPISAGPAGGGAGAGGDKTRYLMLAVTKLGKVVVHKAKRNSNLTFSKGKTWGLEDVRVVEVVEPTTFALTMTVRRYQWTTDRPREQQHFLHSIVKVYRTYTKGQTPELIGFTMDRPDSERERERERDRRPSSSHTTTGGGGGNGSGMDLRPPSFKSRQGSSSSMASASSLASDASGGHARRWNGLGSGGGSGGGAGDTTPTPRQDGFGRSPLSAGGLVEMGPRGSVDEMRSPTGQGQGQGPIGLGFPPHAQQGRPAIHVRASSRPSHEVFASPSPAQAAPPPSASSSSLAPAPARPARAAARSANNTPQPASNDRIPSPPMISITTSQSPSVPQSSVIPPSSSLSPSGPSPGGTASTLAPAPSSTLAPLDGSPHPAGQKPRRRASFHPPPLETAFSREVLLKSRTGMLPSAGAGMVLDEEDEGGRGESGGDAVMQSVEEMLEGFEWTMGVGQAQGKKGADAIEGRLTDELAALDSANIHAFLESDDRIAQVLGHIDEALLELDEIDAQITGYKMQLNAVTDDISFIESQNRGLQVQTSNQKALLDELRQLLQIAEVPPEDLRILVQESPSTARGVQVLERAAASLYKALQAGLDSANAEVQASVHRLREYQGASGQFCKRLFDYLEITFKYQSDQALGEFKRNKATRVAAGGPVLQPHTSMGEYLMMYEGLVLYVKEMDEDRYQRLCSEYFSTISGLHQAEFKDVLMGFMGQLGPGDNDYSFASAISAVPKTGALAKSRAAMGLGKDTKEVVKKSQGSDTGAGGLYHTALTSMINQIITEEDFIGAFLHLADTESTFADHMELDSYFRRQAARHAAAAGGAGAGMSKGLMQLVRSMMDLVFGFVAGEVGQWVEAAVDRSPVSVLSVIAVTQRLANEAEEENTSIFFAQMFDRLLGKQYAMLDKWINEQVRVIDSAKTIKKRKGAAPFVRHFPIFVAAVEAQVEGEHVVRPRVDAAYEKVVGAIFASVTQIATTARAEGQAAEDKGQLSYHVIVFENMHHFVEDARADVPSLGVHYERARGLYEENLAGYVKSILKRSFGRLMDFFDAVERQLGSTPASEVSLHHTKTTLKKILKDHSAKDMRKAVEVMSKRVDKHLIDETDAVAAADPTLGALVLAVWRAVTAGLKAEVVRDEGLLKMCYEGVGLDFGVGDVDAACKKARQ